MPEGWEWDETLYAGSAPYYVRGRLPYAPGLAERLTEFLALDGRGRLLDVGCGPGVLTLLLADRFVEAVGVDADAGMLAEAERRAAEAGIGNVRWVRVRAEELPLDLGTFRVATFGQSFHWMDRDRVAAVVFAMLEPGGAVVHVSDVKEPRPAPSADLPYPIPPNHAIGDLVRSYLGPVRRAGQGLLRFGTPNLEDVPIGRAGFAGPERLRIPTDDVVIRSADDLIAQVFSHSGSTPHLFGERRDEFEADLRRVLRDASPSGHFAEQPPDTEVMLWRKPEA